MRADVKEKWIAALRSGEFKQGKHFLTTFDEGERRDCCLGVLCEVAIREGVEIERTVVPEWDHDHREITVFGYEDGIVAAQRRVLPVQVAKWAGLDTNPMVDDAAEHRQTLANLNDEGRPFSKIADAIERSL